MHKNRKTCDWPESGGELMQTYHDREWGVPAWDDRQRGQARVRV
jgi:3-methyladenine DNA glycosylase Tag